MYTSVSSYSFSQYIKAGKLTQFDCIAKAKELGFDAIEFIDLAPHDGSSEEEYAVKLAQEAERCGIKISAYTIGACLIQDTDEQLKAEMDRVKHKIDVAALLKAPLMRHDAFFSQNKYRSFDLALPELAANIRELAEYGKSKGVKTTVENHGRICQDSDRMERIFNAVNHENFGLLVDMGNFMCVDEDPALAVSRVAPYAFHVHAKDFVRYEYGAAPLTGSFPTRSLARLSGAVCGTGDVPVQQCLHILKTAGYDGCVTIEYEGEMDCIAALEQGLKNLKQAISNIQ